MQDKYTGQIIITKNQDKKQDKNTGKKRTNIQDNYAGPIYRTYIQDAYI